jgi:hypothetical protein
MFRADLSPDELAALEQEVLRINLRFVKEIIEAKQVCPFARGSRFDGTSVRRVCMTTTPNIDAIIEVIKELEKVTDPQVIVGQIILPRLSMEPRDYLEFISSVGKTNADRFPGSRPVFVYAGFHPQLTYVTESPSRLVPFFRRSPDPLMQVVRLAVLDELHAARPSGSQFWDGTPESFARLMEPRPESITDRVARENHEKAINGELERWKMIMDDIAEDRAQAYAPWMTSAT